MYLHLRLFAGSIIGASILIVIFCIGIMEAEARVRGGSFGGSRSISRSVPRVTPTPRVTTPKVAPKPKASVPSVPKTPTTKPSSDYKAVPRTVMKPQPYYSDPYKERQYHHYQTTNSWLPFWLWFMILSDDEDDDGRNSQE